MAVEPPQVGGLHARTTRVRMSMSKLWLEGGSASVSPQQSEANQP